MTNDSTKGVVVATQTRRSAVHAPEEKMGHPADRGVRRLIEERETLLAELEACRNKVVGLDLAIRLLTGKAPEGMSPSAYAPARSEGRQAGVTDVLLGLLKEAGDDGLSARELTDLARQRGRAVKRQSVSSLLSRLKREGILHYDDNRYHLSEDAAEKAADALGEAGSLAA